MGKKSSQGFFYAIHAISQLLDRRDWIRIIPLLIIMVINAILNAIGIAMVVPFIAVAANPEMVHKGSKLFDIFQFFHFNSIHTFLIFLGIIAFVLLFLGNLSNIIVTWISTRVTYYLRYKWSNELFKAYLSQPYEFFLNIRTSDLSKNIVHSVAILANDVVNQFFEVFAKGFSFIAILVLLVIVNPLPALSIVFCVGGVYAIIFLAVRRLLKKTSEHLSFAASETYRVLQETFQAIKEVKLYRQESLFLDAFERPTKLEMHYISLVRSIGPSPRYLLEIFAFGGVVLLVLYLLIAQESLTSFLPVLGFFVVALYRVMPFTQTIFSAFSSIFMHMKTLEEVVEDYKKLNIKAANKIQRPSAEKLFGTFKQLALKNIDFSYLHSHKYAVQDLTLNITSGTVIGFVGPSGAGKTTIIDILLGLLAPKKGQLVVDGFVLETAQAIQSWQSLLAYVPQAIILMNSSIAENIAFGEKQETIDMEKVKRAARFAQLDAFVEALPEQYATHVGDRGVRLSGGQRQRIGIARALYREPQVLILDEATNALDGLTEVEIMRSIHALARGKTIIIIAHRLQTVMACDRLYYIDEARLVAEGDYQTLAAQHRGFQSMIEAAEGNFSEKNQ